MLYCNISNSIVRTANQTNMQRTKNHEIEIEMEIVTGIQNYVEIEN